MGDIIKICDDVDLATKNSDVELVELSGNLLCEVRKSIDNNALSVPIAELSTLGAAVSSLIPALNKVTCTTSISSDDLFQLVNAEVGDVLKQANNGNYYPSLKRKGCKDKLAQFRKVESLPATTKIEAINPATMMMSVALYSITKEIQQIAKMEKQIKSFLENEKEAEIEADLEILMGILSKYKLNWDNEHFVVSNHKLVLDIQRTARRNMNTYQKSVSEMLKEKEFLIAQNRVNSTFNDLKQKFQYYRLSLYVFSFASLMEILLSGNFGEEYITGIKNEISSLSDMYRELFSKCSIYLEKMGVSAIEVNVAKGIGTAEEAVGKFIGSIPFIKEGPVDEFLQKKGALLQQNASSLEKKAVKAFSEIHNPETKVFLDKMDDMIHIFNRTSRICFDNENIYLLAN